MPKNLTLFIVFLIVLVAVGLIFNLMPQWLFLILMGDG